MPNILHIGMGNFHRAHQAWYTQKANALGGAQWRITGVSLRSPTIRDTLRPQSYGYTLAIKDASGTAHVKMDVHDDVLVGGEDRPDIVAFIADADTSVVTLTVSEKGYHLDAATGALDLTSPAIIKELETGEPTTAIGFLAHGLKARAAAHGAPINIISCDNLPENGGKLLRAVTAFCKHAEFDLDSYLAASVAFPSAMIDRIVPSTTDALRAEIERDTGVADAHPIATEAFSEWYLERNFTAPIPAWGSVGVRIVDDVAPFELRKLRLLNGAHSFLAYAGLNAGYCFVHEAISDPALRQTAVALMMEAAETLPDESRTEADGYANALVRRFENPNLNHALQQIAMDGSLKLPIRILPVIAERRSKGKKATAGEMALAAWSEFVVGQLRLDKALNDPKHRHFMEIASKESGDSALARSLLQSIGAET